MWALDFRLVQAKTCGFQLLEKGFDLEAFAVIVTGHFAQIHVRQQRNRVFVPFAKPIYSIVAVAGIF